MLEFLPPIGNLAIDGGSNGNKFTEMTETEKGKEPKSDALFTAQTLFRPKATKSSSDNPDEEFRRPVPSQNGLESESGFEENESLRGMDMENGELDKSFKAMKTQTWKGFSASKAKTKDMASMVDTLGQLATVSNESEKVCNMAAERPTDNEQGQPQKLSFENELTFIPKLNALSLKIAQSRTSVAKRIKVSCESRVAALEEEMAQNFTFRPSISENSMKIADRLKTDFWTRQKLHTEKQKKILETAPSTWHPKLKLSFIPKQSMSFTEGSLRDKPLGQACLDHVCAKSEASINLAFDNKKEATDSLPTSSPPKSNGKFLHAQKKTATQEIQPKRLECLKPRALKKLEQRKLRSEKAQGSLDDTAIRQSTNSVSCSPDKFSGQHYLSNSVDSALVEAGHIERASKVQARSLQKRSKAIPLNNGQSLNKPLVIDPDRFLRTKNSAEQALRDKKVFICMGPYPVLRASLRRRGWIEKFFKADIVCSNLARVRSPDKVTRDSDDDVDCDDRDDHADDSDRDDGSCDRDDVIGESRINDLTEREATQGDSTKKHVGSNKSAPCKSTRTVPSEDRGHGNSTSRALGGPNGDKKRVETKSRYAYGSTTVGNFEDLQHGFESDRQYGIMSRIARNAVPTLIWTCRRSDIDFNYLTKDQIVNHFVHASSFTTKFGLCINIRNIPWFESVDPDSFFPRCHRLSNENEKQDFVEEFRMLSAIAILRHVVNWQKSETPQSEKVVSSRILMLAMKACQEYLKSKKHQDIEEDQLSELYGLSEVMWNQLIEFFYQINRFKSKIMGADSHVSECKQLLEEIETVYPQCNLHERNVWIVKPGAKSRGRGIIVMDNLNEILKLTSCSSLVTLRENKWVVQKYIERPLLIYNTKFDIRQWFLVTDWNPLTLWFYKDCYLRFCSQEFTLTKFDPEYHLANNSIQKDYANGERSPNLPSNNMWTKDQYIAYLREHGHGEYWDEVIYPSMKQSIIYTLQACQDSLEYRKNSFELYGADFMLSEDKQPWLIEINCSPALGPSTAITEKLCAEVIQDTLKVVLDRRENRSCETGKFELAFKQPYIPIPVYTGNSLLIEGEGYSKPANSLISPQHYTIRMPRPSRLKDGKEARETVDVAAKKATVQSTSPKALSKSADKPTVGNENETKNSLNTNTTILKDEIKHFLKKQNREHSWAGCVCGTGGKCQVVSGYHVQNASLEVKTADEGNKRPNTMEERTVDGDTRKILSKQTLKIARMHRKAKKKIAYATLKYKRADEGPGLSIGPGHGVTQI